MKRPMLFGSLQFDIDSTPKQQLPIVFEKKTKPKVWADLLRKEKATTSSLAPFLETKTHVTSIHAIAISYSPVELHVRGLVNTANTCYMNAILHPLVHCVPFANLFISLKKTTKNLQIATPLIDAILCLIGHFQVEGEALDPCFVYDALRTSKRIESTKGQQEDAEEFFGFILDGLHEEFVKLNPSKLAQDDGIDEWFEVGKKNRNIQTRHVLVDKTPISEIFHGTIRSIVKSSGSKESAVFQPFHTLQLDISAEGIHSLDDALEAFRAPETVHDFQSPTKGIRVDAVKTAMLEKLPPCLVLQLNRIVFDGGLLKKLHKSVSFPPILDLKKELLSLRTIQPSYALFAVIYHHGQEATGGHYTCAILNRKEKEWWHIDDTRIERIQERQVCSGVIRDDGVAYLVLYEQIKGG